VVLIGLLAKILDIKTPTPKEVDKGIKRVKKEPLDD
jgi:hypothetical protein